MIFFKSRLFVLIFFATHLSWLYAASPDRITHESFPPTFVEFSTTSGEAMIRLSAVQQFVTAREQGIMVQHKKEIKALQEELCVSKLSFEFASSFNVLSLKALTATLCAQRKTIEEHKKSVRELCSQVHDCESGKSWMTQSELVALVSMIERELEALSSSVLTPAEIAEQQESRMKLVQSEHDRLQRERNRLQSERDGLNAS